MNQSYFEHLKSHAAMLAIARQLLDSGLVTPEEYHKIEAVLSRKKCPDSKPQRNTICISNIVEADKKGGNKKIT